MLECVMNVSEGRDRALLTTLSRAAGASLCDRHSDPDHHRSVFTLAHEDADALLHDVRQFADVALEVLTLDNHVGVHPRLGVLDVVPFVALAPSDIATARQLRGTFADWVARTHHVPVFLYGEAEAEKPTLPEIRRRAFVDLSPDVGPHQPHPTAGAICAGARGPLIAWNMWLSGTSLARTRDIARALRQPGLRTLALEVGGATQVSCNFIDIEKITPDVALASVLAALGENEHLLRTELVGLIPQELLQRMPRATWAACDLDPERTVEFRRARAADAAP